MTKAIIPTDIFVVIPDGIGEAIFAKNSHRPQNEVQEIIYIKGDKRDSDTLKVKLNYIYSIYFIKFFVMF